MLLIDKYAYNNELRDYNPQAKFFLACVGLLIFRIIDNEFLYILNIVFMTGVTVLVAKIPFKKYLDMFKIPFVFLIMSLVTILISINNTDYIYSIHIFGLDLGFTYESLLKCKTLFLAVFSSLSSIYFLMLTTPMIQIIKGLKKIKVPGLIIELMILIYRSIFIFLDEMHNMDLAQRMKFGYENKRNSINSISLLIGNLFRKILEKNRDMNIALECKLYDGEFKVGD